MDIKIQGHEMKISDDMNDFVEQKVGKLERYLPNIASVRVDLSRKPTKRGADLAIAQITLRHSRGAILRTEERLPIEDRATIRLALTGAVDKMYKRIRRFKGKKDPKRIRDRFSMTVEEIEQAEDVPDATETVTADAAADADYDMYEEVIRYKTISVTPMNEQEAAEQMELLGHDFFLFFNSETNGVNVLYRRSSGGYGVLVPEVT